jgi:8-oxo-dGTP pyrophosphatase MutT (NUDIX family)
VIAYATRERNGRKELLVFDLPEEPGTPTQVPAGRLDPGESLEQALARELFEETGLRVRRIVRRLAGPDELDADKRPGVDPYENYAFEVDVGETPETWDHVCVSEGDDDGFVFRCRWVPLMADLKLWRTGTDSVLPKLLES